MKNCIYMIVFLACSMTHAGDCNWVTLFVDQDTTALEAFPGEVQDPNDEVLRISSFNSTWFNGQPGRERVFLRFKTDSVVPGIVTQAEFQIYQTDGIIYPGQFIVEQVSGDWDQSVLTWNNQPEVLDEPVGMLTNGIDQWLQFESDQLAHTIETWLRSPQDNHGLRIRFEDEYYNGNPNGARGDSFRSREVQGALPASITFLLCAPCLGDFDLNGRVDFFDVSAFLVYYQMGSDLADLNEDGIINFFDVSTLLNAYAACGN